jgi:hypothetical protein
MHGDGNRWYSKHNWQCGKAGEMLLIERNTILYTAGKAIKIRGNPTDKAVVDGNVFKHDTGAAIRQNGACGFLNNVTNPIDVRNNDFGVDPFTALGRGDFAGAGDGREDEFLATGVTWWAKSPETGQWRFLNTMPERLSQILLQRTDLDLVCDVVLRPERRDAEPTLYSKGGTTPWIPIPIVVGGTPDTPVVG